MRLSPLSAPHRYIDGSVRWALLERGISIEGAAPAGTDGPPETATRVWGWFANPIIAAENAFGVPREILVAIVCTESAGGQTDREAVCTARREEPDGRVSVGCCQTLLSTARMVLHRPMLQAEDLHDPATSILAAAAYIGSQHRLTRMDPVLIAAAYNAGGLYAEPIEANRWRLRCYPLGTGHYLDRFVAWYNDAVAVLR